MRGKKGCVLCGCPDHRLVGCHRHAAKRCSCFRDSQRQGGG